MFGLNFSRFFRTKKTQPFRRKAKRVEKKSYLRVEQLEERAMPANFTAGNLAVMELANNTNNTTAQLLELSPSIPNQASPVQTVNITSGTGANAATMRYSDSGTSSYISLSNDRTQLDIGGYNTTDTTDSDLANSPATDRTIISLDNTTAFTLETSYTGQSGNQVRDATTTDDSDYYITDKGGLYTNGSGPTGALGQLNIGEARSFGGTVYISTTRTSSNGNTYGSSILVVTSPTASTATGLSSNIPTDANINDFYMVQSGQNGAAYDTLYKLNTSGIQKYADIGGTWTAEGSYAFSGGLSLAAANDGSGGVYLYVTTATTVVRITDTAAYNSTMTVNGANNVTLFTASGSDVLKGIDFVPVPAGSVAPTLNATGSTNVYYQNPQSTFTIVPTDTPSPAATFSLSGAPTWVTINSTTGVLTIDTPNAPTETSTTNYTFNVIAQNGVGSPASESFTVSVVYGDPTISSANNTSIYAGLSGTFQVSAEAGPPITSYSLASAPSWVSINSSTGLMTMTDAPAVSTTTAVNFTVNVTNAAGTTPQSFTITELPTISYATQSSDYTQNFSSLPDAGGTATINETATSTGQYDLTGASPNGFGATTDTSMAGWYSVNLDAGNPERFGQGEPSTTTGALFDFNDGTTDSQSLGTISTSTTASRFGAVLVNNTGTTLNTFTLSYLGEEWWANSGSGTGMTFSYSLGAGLQTAINPANPVGSLGFSAPVTGTAEYLDGSQSANQVSVNSTVNNITWLPGQALTIEWDKGTTGSSDGLGVADVQFSASYQAQSEPTITNAPSAYATVGTNGTYQLTASATPAATWSLSGYNSGTVPSWISVTASTGVLTFTNPPALPVNGADAAFTFTVTANNGVGTPATQTFTVIETNPASAFNPNDLLLYQTGNNNSSDPVYAAEAPVSLQEISPVGPMGSNYVENVPVADNTTIGGTGNQPLSEDLGTTANKNGTGDGQLELSLDGTEVAFGGNDDWLNATDFSTSNRVIGIMGNSPSSLNTTTYGPFDGGDDMRGAVSVGSNSSTIYSFGHTTDGGLRYFDGTGNSPVDGTEVDQATTAGADANIRDAIIGFNGQVYYSSDKGAGPGIFISETTAGVPVYQPTTSSGDMDYKVMSNPAGNNPNGMFLADMNGDGVLDTGDRMYFLDSSDGLYVSTYTSPTGTSAYGTWTTPTAVTGGAPVSADINYVGLTGQVINPGTVGIASITSSGTTATLTLSGSTNQFTAGESITIAGNSDSTYNGTFPVSSVSGNTVLFTDNSADGNPGTGGTITGTAYTQLYFTSADGTGNSSVWALTDTGSASQTATEIESTSSTNGGMQYNGVALAPYATATSISLTINGSSASQVSATFGTTVTFVATVPTGLAGTTVYFDNAATQTEIGSAVVQSNGTATFTSNSLNAGQYTVEAYTGGEPGTYAPAASTTQTLSITGSTSSQASVNVSPSPSTVNEATTITAAIAPASGTGAYPTGTVAFYSNSQLLGTVAITAAMDQGGSSTVNVPFTTTALAQGTDSIVAVYSGDNTYESATGNASETVNAGATIAITTSNPDPNWNAGSPPSVTLTATVTGNGLSGLPNGSPTGQVQFYLLNEDGSTTDIGSPVNLTEGSSANVYTATTSYTFGGPGSVLVEAEYLPGGSSDYASITTATNSVPGVVDTAVQAFAQGDLIALERPAQASNASNPVYLVEFNSAGTAVVQSIILPIGSSGSTNIVGLSPHASTEGALATSANGSYISLEGFDVTIGTTSVTSTPSSTDPRTSTSITDLGVVDTSTAVTEPSSSALSNVRGAVTFDGKEFWIAGDSTNSNSGLQFVTDGGTTTVPLGPDDTSYTDVQIIGGNLYVAGGAGVISEVTGSTDLPGTTLPDGGTVSVTPLPGLAAAYSGAGLNSPAPYGFVMFNDSNGSTTSGLNVLYVGDQNYGLLKFYFNGTDWVFAGQKLNNSGSIEGLTGTWSSGGVALYMTAAQGTGFPGNQIATYTDTEPYNQPFATGLEGGNIHDTYTLPLDNTSTFSGIAFSPLVQAAVTLTGSAGSVTYGSEQSLTLTATVTGTGTPTGTVDFFANGTYLGSGTLNGSGVATYTLTSSQLAIDAYQFTARYDGDSNNGGAFSPDLSGDVDYTPGDIIVDAVSTGTTVGGTIASITESGTTATVTTTSATGLAAGKSVTISGAAVSGYNGTYNVVSVSGSTFTITATSGLVSAGAGGTVFYNYSNLGGATSLLDYSSTGTLNSGNTVTLTSTGSGALTENASATNEGYLTDSSNGQSVDFAGYNVAAGTSTAGTNSTTGPNGLIGVLNPNGTVNDSTVIPYANTQETTTGTSPKTANSIKAVASADGLGFYVATDDYIQYVPLGNTASSATTTVEEEFTGNDGTSGQFASSQSPSDVALGGSDVSNTEQLYGDAGSEAQTDGVPAADGPFSVGTGLPTTAGQSATVYGGPSTSEDSSKNFVTSEQFAFSPSGLSFFVADARTDGEGGLYLYQESTGATAFTETASYTYSATGLTGLSVNWNAVGGPLVYAVTTNANPGDSGNSIVAFQTTLNEAQGSGSISAPTTVATAPATAAFRGVALAPTAPSTTTTTTALSVTNNTGQYGSVTLTATVTGSSPTGYVSFQTSSGAEIGSAPVINGTATLTPDTDFLAGSYTGLVAVYSGDANNAPSTSVGMSATVAKYATGSTLTDVDSGTAINGQADLLTDTLSIPTGSAPTGTVTFYNGSTQLGTGTVTQEIVNGSPVFVATYSWTPSAVGTDSLSAVYSGDSNFLTTTSNESVTVINPTTTVVTSNAQNPSGNGGTVIFTATVSGSYGTPTGTVQFYINGIAIGGPVTLNGSGVATLGPETASLTETAPGVLTPGVDSITAVYTPAGGSSYAGGTGYLNQTVQAQALTAGDTLVYQVGDTTTTNFNSSDGDNENVVYIDEYTPSQTLVEQIVMPSVTSNGYDAFTQQTDNGTAGFINQTLSGNGYVFGGVDYGLGAIPGTAPASIAFLSDSGTVTVDTVDTANQGYQLRSVASVNGTSFYEGTSNGVYYIPAGTDGAATALATGVTGRNVLIAPAPTGGDQLYISSATAVDAGVSTVGTGLPTTTGQTVTLLSSTMTTEIGSSFGPYDYKFAELDPADGYAVDTLYVLNDSTGATGGVQKWTYASGAWTYTTANPAGNTSATEDTALAVSVTSGVVTISVMSDTQFAASAGGQVVTLTDNSGYGGTGFASATTTLEESAPSNTSWHGDAFVAVATQTTIASNVALGSLTGADSSITFTATVTSTNETPAPSQPFPGTVQFYDGLVPLGSPVALTSSGTASITVTTSLTQQAGLHITPGVDSITAVYSGDFDGDYNSTSGYESTSATVNQVVQAQAFGTGDQLVYRVGDGTTALTSYNGTAAVFVDEYNSSGHLVQSIAMPTADATGSDGNYYHALVQISSGASNPSQFAGQLTLSGDGQYVFLTGYDDNPTTAVNAATDNALRSIARISSSGVVQIETINNATITTGSFNSDITGVYSPDGNQVWVDGTEDFGLMYVPTWQPGQTTIAATQAISGLTGSAFINELGLESNSGNLYMAVTSDSPTPFESIFNLGSLSSLTSAGALSASGLTNAVELLTTHKYYTDVYFASSTLMYVAYESGSSTNAYGNGGIAKYDLISGTWTLEGSAITASTTLGGTSSNEPTAGDPGFVYLSGSGGPGNVTLYMGYAYEGTIQSGVTAITGQVYKLTDTNGATSGFSSTTPTTLITETTGSTYVGEELHGMAAVPVAATVTVTTNQMGPFTPTSPLTFTATIAGNPSVGTVVFYAGPGLTNPIGSPVAVVNGTAVSTPATTFPDGSNTVTAVYDQDGSGTDTFTVSSTTSTTTTLADNGPNPSIVGNTVNFTGTVSPSVPDGDTVVLEDASNGNAIVATTTTMSSGFTFNVSNLSIGTHDLFAVYNPTGSDASFGTSSSGQVAQVVNPIQVTSVVTNGDYIPITGISLSSGTVTVTTDGNSGFTAGNTVVIAGYTGANAGYNGSWTLATVSGNAFTYADGNTGMSTLSFNSLGYAISLNTTSALNPGGPNGGHQRSMVDSIAYNFNTPVSLAAGATTLGVVGGITVTGPATPATAVPGESLTSLNGGMTWVVTFSSAVGNTVVGHSIADGVYTINLNSTDVTAVSGGSTMTTTRPTDTFYRLYGDTNADHHVNTTDANQFNNTDGLNTGQAGYLAYLDENADGHVNTTDANAFNNRDSAFWSGFTPTI